MSGTRKIKGQGPLFQRVHFTGETTWSPGRLVGGVWLVPDGPSYSSGDLSRITGITTAEPLDMVFFPKMLFFFFKFIFPKLLSLIHMCSKEGDSRSLPGLLRLRFRRSSITFCQSKSLPEPRFTGWGNRLLLLMGGAATTGCLKNPSRASCLVSVSLNVFDL